MGPITEANKHVAEVLELQNKKTLTKKDLAFFLSTLNKAKKDFDNVYVQRGSNKDHMNII